MPIESLTWGYGVIEGPRVAGAGTIFRLRCEIAGLPAPLARI